MARSASICLALLVALALSGAAFAEDQPAPSGTVEEYLQLLQADYQHVRDLARVVYHQGARDGDLNLDLIRQIAEDIGQELKATDAALKTAFAVTPQEVKARCWHAFRMMGVHQENAVSFGDMLKAELQQPKPSKDKIKETASAIYHAMRYVQGEEQKAFAILGVPEAEDPPVKKEDPRAFKPKSETSGQPQ